MTYQQLQEFTSVQADPGQPLIGVMTEEQGRDVVHHFTTERDADRVLLEDTTEAALALAGYLHGRAPFVELIIPLIREHQAAIRILVYAEVIEHLKGLPDFPRRRRELHLLPREI